MSSPRDSSSPRRLVEQFAAHLAHLLNTGSGKHVHVSPFELYRSLVRTLSSAGYSRLVGLGLVAPGTTVERAAERYFDAVLDRRLFLRGNEQRHKGHALFLALCRRGAAQGWELATLERRHASQLAALHNGGTTSKGPSTSSVELRHFTEVANNLAKLDHTVSAGNPAATTLAHLGPLILELGNANAVTPEELSLWKSIVCAPRELEVLARGKEFDAFCSMVIKAVEAANAPFASLVALGLSPRDWAGEISTNTAKKLGAFLSDVRKANAHDGTDEKSATVNLEAWRRIWAQRQVPGYGSADELWSSALGRAIRFPVVARSVEIGCLDDEIDRAIVQDGEFMADDQDFQSQVTAAARNGIVDEFDIWLLNAVRDRHTIDELKPDPRVRLRIGPGGDLAAYFDELTERLLNWARGTLGLLHPDKDGDTPEDQ